MSKSNTATRLEHDGWDYEVEIEPEDLELEGAFASGDDELDAEERATIERRLSSGDVFAWCCVSVTATERKSKPGFMPRTGHDSIGACSYKNRRDLEQDLIPDLKRNARELAYRECPKLLPECARAAYDMLMKDRTADYGYDRRAFRRISNQRSRARNAVRVLTENGRYPERLNWHAAGDRLTFKQNPNTGRWSAEYVVGQSSNEEITNLLRRLVNPEASWQS